MTSLYDTLGVAKDATKDAIKSAYRKAAKKAHPDVGGSAEVFGALTQAYDILSDDARREKYDATGETEAHIDNSLAQAINIISGILDNLLMQEDATKRDLVAEVRKHLTGEAGDVRAHIKEGRRIEAHLEKSRTRFKTKSGNNLMAAMVAEKLDRLRASLRGAEDRLELLGKACEITDDHEFTFDKPEPKPSYEIDDAQLEEMLRNASRQARGQTSNFFFRNGFGR